MLGGGGGTAPEGARRTAHSALAPAQHSWRHGAARGPTGAADVPAVVGCGPGHRARRMDGHADGPEAGPRSPSTVAVAGQCRGGMCTGNGDGTAERSAVGGR